MYIDQSIKRYLDDLAARKSTPGGGSAAALTATLGTSLIMMVANYSIRKQTAGETQGIINEILDKAGKHDEHLRELIDQDVTAFEKLSGGLKALSGNPDNSARDELYKAAIEPPFLVCEITHNCIKLCEALAEHGNRNLVTDTAIAAILLESAYVSAKYNVYINLGYIKDAGYIAKVNKVMAPLEKEMGDLKDSVLEKCQRVIYGGSIGRNT